MITSLHNQWRTLYTSFTAHRQKLAHLPEETRRAQLEQLAQSKGISYPIHWREIMLLPLARQLSRHLSLPHLEISGPTGNSSAITLLLSTEREQPPAILVDIVPMNLLPEHELPILGIIDHGESVKPRNGEVRPLEIPLQNDLDLPGLADMIKRYNYAQNEKTST